MRFSLGPPPEDDAVRNEGDTWQPLKEPSRLRFQVLAVFAALAVTIGIALSLLARDSRLIADISWPTVMLLIVLIVPVHEFLHAVCFKGGFMSRRVVFGFYAKAFAFYAHYRSPVTRRRYITISLFPFLVLTVTPLLIVTLLRAECRYLVEVILANGTASAGDILTVIFVARQAPKESILINSGTRTYWRPAGSRPTELDAG